MMNSNNTQLIDELKQLDQEYADSLQNNNPLFGDKFRHVRCQDCNHFERDQIGDGSGVGNCKTNAFLIEKHRQVPYPSVVRNCGQYSPKYQEAQ